MKYLLATTILVLGCSGTNTRNDALEDAYVANDDANMVLDAAQDAAVQTDSAATIDALVPRDAGTPEHTHRGLCEGTPRIAASARFDLTGSYRLLVRTDGLWALQRDALGRYRAQRLDPDTMAFGTPIPVADPFPGRPARIFRRVFHTSEWSTDSDHSLVIFVENRLDTELYPRLLNRDFQWVGPDDASFPLVSIDVLFPRVFGTRLDAIGYVEGGECVDPYRVATYEMSQEGSLAVGVDFRRPIGSLINVEGLASGFWLSAIDCVTSEVGITFLRNDGTTGPTVSLGRGPLSPRMRPDGLGIVVRRAASFDYEVTRMADDGSVVVGSTVNIHVPNAGIYDRDHEVSLAGTALVSVGVWPSELSDQAILSVPREGPPQTTVIARSTNASFPPNLFWANGALYAHDIDLYTVHRIVCD